MKEPQILRPFDRAEVLSIAEAAAIAGRKVRTLRDWCLRHDIGRRIEGQWALSPSPWPCSSTATGTR